MGRLTRRRSTSKTRPSLPQLQLPHQQLLPRRRNRKRSLMMIWASVSLTRLHAPSTVSIWKNHPPVSYSISRDYCASNIKLHQLKVFLLMEIFRTGECSLLLWKSSTALCEKNVEDSW